MSNPKYQTKPFACWNWAKELRADYISSLWQARDKKKTLVGGSVQGSLALLAGLGDHECLNLGAFCTTIFSDRHQTIECSQALQNMGYGNDVCAALGFSMASLLTGRNALGTPPLPDFYFTTHICEVEGKIGHILAEHRGIPHFVLDHPVLPRHQIGDTHHRYLISQMHDAIDWMEKVTGREYDDERLIEGTYNEWETSVLWSKICELNKAIPAPLDQKSMGAFWFPASVRRADSGTVEFYRTLYDEIKDRVQNRIAAVSNERCRLLHEGYLPWHFLRLFRIGETYGAAFIGSRQMFGYNSAFMANEDGAWTIAKSPKEQGIELKTRDDALRALADLVIMNITYNSSTIAEEEARDTIKRIQDWSVDGVVFHFDRGCHVMPSMMPEVRIALRERGIPTMVYEGNSANPDQFDQIKVVGSLESFFESLGLNRLTD